MFAAPKTLTLYENVKICGAHRHYARTVTLSFYFYIYERFRSIVKHTISSSSYNIFSLVIILYQ